MTSRTSTWRNTVVMWLSSVRNQACTMELLHSTFDWELSKTLTRSLMRWWEKQLRTQTFSTSSSHFQMDSKPKWVEEELSFQVDRNVSNKTLVWDESEELTMELTHTFYSSLSVSNRTYRHCEGDYQRSKDSSTGWSHFCSGLWIREGRSGSSRQGSKRKNDDCNCS